MDMATNQEAPRRCQCRCGAQVKNNYASGHDARHLAETVRWIRDLAEDVKAGRRPSHDLITPVERAVELMPTEALKRKLALRLAKMGWLVFGREARGLAEYHRDGLARYGDSGTHVAWRRTFRGVQVAEIAPTDDVYFGLLAIAGWSRTSAALAAS